MVIKMRTYSIDLNDVQIHMMCKLVCAALRNEAGEVLTDDEENILCEILDALTAEEGVCIMHTLKSGHAAGYFFTLTYDDAITTFWVTKGAGMSTPYQVSFSLLSEAERFFDLLVEQANKS